MSFFRKKPNWPFGVSQCQRPGTGLLRSGCKVGHMLADRDYPTQHGHNKRFLFGVRGPTPGWLLGRPNNGGAFYITRRFGFHKGKGWGTAEPLSWRNRDYRANERFPGSHIARGPPMGYPTKCFYKQGLTKCSALGIEGAPFRGVWKHNWGSLGILRDWGDKRRPLGRRY